MLDEFADDAFGEAGPAPWPPMSMPIWVSLTLTLAWSLRAGDGVEQLVVDGGGLSACETWTTLSPSESRETSMPSALSSAAAARASATVMPATKRREMRRPIDERSEKARKVLFRESAMKVERSKTGSPLQRVVDSLFFHEHRE